MDSDIKDTCYNIQDCRLGIRYLAAMLRDVVRRRRRRRRRRWAHAPVIHAASHVDHEKRVETSIESSYSRSFCYFPNQSY